MAKDKPYELMSDDELAEARIALDIQIAELRTKKKEIQDEVDRRQAKPEGGAHQISNAGGIKSQEKVGKHG